MKTSIVDTPDFAALNPQLRDGIREAEAGIRQVMAEFLAALPEPLRPLLAGIVEEMPRKFLLSQLSVYVQFDEMFKLTQLVASKAAAGPVQ